MQCFNYNVKKLLQQQKGDIAIPLFRQIAKTIENQN